jgi:hypothetical protein
MRVNRRNDIITVLSQQDEHCWVGELNGLAGWFPAKFVQVRYSIRKYFADFRPEVEVTKIILTFSMTFFS